MILAQTVGRHDTTDAPHLDGNSHTAVWNGNEMIVWGGLDGSHIVLTPEADTIR